MKLLFYSLNFLPKDIGGMEIQLYHLIKKLKKYHEISLVLPSRHNILIHGVQTYRIPTIFPHWGQKKEYQLKSFLIGFISLLCNSLATIFYFFWIYMRKKIDLVNVYQGSLFATIVLFLSTMFKKKTTLNLRGPEGYSTKFNQFLLETSIILSKLIIINSPSMLDSYKSKSLMLKHFANKKNVIYIPNGIDVHFWSPNSKRIKNDKDLIFVGNLLDRSHIINKGFKVLYDAIIYLKQIYSLSLKIEVLGNHDLALLKKLISKEIEQHFIFKGLIRDRNVLKSEIQKAKVFILSSLSEGMPNSLMEAMALEMPCIASDVGAVKNLIDDRVNGLLYERGNYIKLAKLIFELLKDENLQKKLGMNARKKIVKYYNLDDIIHKKIEKIYQKIIEN
ncbi:MAG: glycosyltransferase family 4 protein [Promethearchaeota archaeon]